jgi:GR25 family glycosyltransferase involved in LPS biosynthesis
MNLTIDFKAPEIAGAFDWQLCQEINVSNEHGEVIAKAEIELITINKHRDALGSYALLADESTDWELPLNLYFKGQNLNKALCEQLNITPETKKAKVHILLEAISVVPKYRQQAVGQYLLKEIAKHHAKAQSVTVLSMPMHHFVDANDCEDEDNKAYYQTVDIQNEKLEASELANFFSHNGFVEFNVDESLLAEPMPYQIFVASPQSILGE